MLKRSQLFQRHVKVSPSTWAGRGKEVLSLNLDSLLAWRRAKLKRSQFFQRHVKGMDIHNLAGSDLLALELDYLPVWLASISAWRGLCSRYW